MFRERRRRYLERAALREAQKAMRREGSFTREDVRHLRMQTAEPWMRVIAILCGFFFWGMAWVVAQKEMNPWAIGFLGLLGLFLVGAGLIGHKKSVEAVLDGIVRRQMMNPDLGVGQYSVLDLSAAVPVKQGIEQGENRKT